MPSARVRSPGGRHRRRVELSRLSVPHAARHFRAVAVSPERRRAQQHRCAPSAGAAAAGPPAARRPRALAERLRLGTAGPASTCRRAPANDRSVASVSVSASWRRFRHPSSRTGAAPPRERRQSPSRRPCAREGIGSCAISPAEQRRRQRHAAPPRAAPGCRRWPRLLDTAAPSSARRAAAAASAPG